MELSIGERLGLIMILPKEGDFLSLKVVRALREELSDSLRQDEESGALAREEDGRFKWLPEQDRLVDMTFAPKAVKIISERLEQLDKQKKLTENLLSLYEKFIPEQD